MPYRKQAVHYLAENDPHMKSLYPTDSHKLKYFHKTKELCLQTAKQKGIFPHQNVIVIVNDDNIAMFCTEEGILLTPTYYVTSALAHEMVHSFHIGHSYSNRLVRVYPYSAVGEYDDVYDLMSTANAYMYQSAYGFSGPGLNGPHLDYLGWLPMDRVRYFGLKGETDEVLNLASLSVPHARTEAMLLLQMPYDRNRPNNVYTVELRTRHNNDVGVKRNAVLIHKLKEGLNGHLFSYLITNDLRRRHEWLPGDTWTVFLGQNKSEFIQMTVKYIDSARNTASIRVRSTFDPSNCDDKTSCSSTSTLPPLTTALYDRDNNCPPGYSPRLSGPKDKVCLTNSQPKSSMGFFAQPTFGLNRCKTGYVWRMIDAYDYVCVTEQEHRDSLAQNRRFCNSTTVKRNAFPKDPACVSKAERDEMHAVSWRGRLKLEYRKFFNGVDQIF